MLVPVIFIVALLLTLATAMLENGLFAAKIALNRSVERYSELAVADGVLDFTADLANFVQHNGSSGPWRTTVSRSAPQAVCAPTSLLADCPPFLAVVEGSITDAAGAGTATTTADIANSVQTSIIGEGRISAVVSATITGPDRTTVLGTRTRLLTYRVFESAPYAILSGSRDAAAASGSLGTAQGDSGGARAQWGPAAADGGASHDTRIHVQLVCTNSVKKIVPFVNDQHARGNDGLPWGNAAGQAYETKCNQPAAPADAFANEAWTNGNTNASGWTQ